MHRMGLKCDMFPKITKLKTQFVRPLLFLFLHCTLLVITKENNMHDFTNELLNLTSCISNYLKSLLMHDFSWTKLTIFGILVFILFELIIGWYIPKSHKKVLKK